MMLVVCTSPTFLKLGILVQGLRLPQILEPLIVRLVILWGGRLLKTLGLSLRRLSIAIYGARFHDQI